MSFNKDTKARMFVRCARICCLCFKQCGTNIEAAHVISETDGGPNTDDNGIPVCMDCHTEIGHYDPHHPKGNKFTPEELMSRRDQVYRLVESGVLQAMIVASRTHDNSSASSADKKLPESAPTIPSHTKVSKEAGQVLEAARQGRLLGEALPRKLSLLDQQDQAYVLDKLLEDYDQGENMAALMVILASNQLGTERTLVVTEQFLRKITLSNDCFQKAKFMEFVPVELLKTTDEGLRISFFTEIIGIMHNDQYEEVNKITPAVPKVQEAIPDEFKAQYVAALLDQVNSSAWHGAPAACKAINDLPDEIALKALEAYEFDRFLQEKARKKLHDLLGRTKSRWPTDKVEIFNDYIGLPWYEFCEKHLNE